MQAIVVDDIRGWCGSGSTSWISKNDPSTDQGIW